MFCVFRLCRLVCEVLLELVNSECEFCWFGCVVGRLLSICNRVCVFMFLMFCLLIICMGEVVFILLWWMLELVILICDSLVVVGLGVVFCVVVLLVVVRVRFSVMDKGVVGM